MKILLKVDYDGEPYLLLKTETPVLAPSTECTESEVLELFIRKAKKQGIRLVNETNIETCNDYATIRLGDNINNKNEG